MPDPPSVGLFTRFVLENPYPLGVGLAAFALVLVVAGFREGRMDRVRLAGVPLLLAVAVLATGTLVVTSAERGKQVTRALVDALVADDAVGAMRLFADDALLHLGATTNVGYDIDFIRDGVSRFVDRFDVVSNRVTMLDGYRETADRATIHLGAWTDAGGFGPAPSQWVVVVERQTDDTWKVTDLTLISVAGRAPPTSW
ncbi:MAG: hypothetical protein HKO59_02610 [Phycisphaerales bacterium]|nr:hypothetical protein [Phycisphaerae bacterium]NNF44779.1 hypothetical protein [Phycisphaerales bacterium]NNM24873.1 hypothetical protein [Phycisphaerales bacterium]